MPSYSLLSFLIHGAWELWVLLIFEIVDWSLLVFLIFGRGLRSLISAFWTFIYSIKTLSFSSFILSSLVWDCRSMVITSVLWPFWALLLISSGFTWVWRKGVFFDWTSPFDCIICYWSERKLLLLASTFGNWFSHFNSTFNFMSLISMSERYLFFIMVRRIVASLSGCLYLGEQWVSMALDFLEGKNAAV